METVTWHELLRLVRLALMGVGAAFAAVVLSLLLGSGAAQAADDEDRGLLGAVTGLVDETTSTVGSTVTGVTSTATDVVAAVVDVTPAPVQPVVQAVTSTVSDTVTTTVAPVQQIVAAEVVTTVTTPVVDVVAAVPVVGDVVSALGADDALTAIAADLDSTLAVLAGAVTSTGEALAPEALPLPEHLVPSYASDRFVASTPIDIAAAGATASAGTSARPATAVAAVPASATIVALATAGIAATDTTALLTSMGALCLSVISSGPGGAGLGVWALAALLPFVAHRAWVRRAGPEDQLVPASPAGSTDVSPD